MSAELFNFPSPDSLRPAPLAGAAYPMRRYDFRAMVRLFGWEADDLAPRTLIQRLRALHQNEGLPLPCNTRMIGGRRATGAAAIWRGSQWDAAAVDAWLHPAPHCPGAVARHPAAPPALRHQLALNAAKMAAGGAN